MTTITEVDIEGFVKAYASTSHPLETEYSDVQSYRGWDIRLVLCKVRDIQDIRRRYNAMLDALKLASELIAKGDFDEAKAVADSGAIYGSMKTTDESPTEHNL